MYAFCGGTLARGRYTQYSEHAKNLGLEAQGSFTLLPDPDQPLVGDLIFRIVQYRPTSRAQRGFVHSMTAAKKALVQLPKGVYDFAVLQDPLKLVSPKAFRIKPIHAGIVARAYLGVVGGASRISTRYLTLQWISPLK